MRDSKILVAILAAALLAASVSSADARWFGHRGRGPGLLGGVIVGAATIATLPFAVLGAAANAASPPPGYDGPRGYGPPQSAYGYGPPPPPRYYRGYAPPGYYNRY